MSNLLQNANFITIDAEMGTRVPKYRKEFKLSGKLKKAELQITSLGIFEAYLNGKRIGDAVLTPGWTEYEHRLQYLTYGITDMLENENCITVGVGPGWFGERMGSTNKNGKSAYGEHGALIAAIKLTYSDGKEDVIVTDESWTAAKSETLQSEIYDGEITDANITSVFDEKVRIHKDYPKSNLIPYEGEYIKEIETVSPKNIIITPKGEKVIDFGQNLVGYLYFNVCGNAGQKVTVKHFEILDKDGNVYTENYRSADAMIEYTLKNGEQSYKPRYTFFGFRYVQLIDWPEDIKAENFKAIVICSDMKRTGYFECGHAKLNKLYENIIWGQKGNYVDIPSDCPQRDERLGWTGDTEVFCRTGCINYNTERFFKKWLHDLSLAQFSNGLVPRVVPNPFLGDKNEMGSAAWGDAATVVPYEVYVAYGEKEILADSFEAMHRWVDYIKSNAPDFIWRGTSHFGDWLGMDAPAGSYKGSTNEELIATAYFYLSCGLVVKTGKILGLDVSKYEEMLPKIKAAFNYEFIKDGKLISSQVAAKEEAIDAYAHHKPKCDVSCDTQTAHVLAIHFGLVDGEVRKNLAKRLIELIEANGDCLQTGFVGTPYLLDTLTEIGRVDKAYTLILQEKFPSWLFSVNMGATTVWEHWDGLKSDGSVWSSDMNSFNHYAYGSCAAWLYRTVCGIMPDESEPAYKHIILRPLPDKRLGYAKASVDTKFGTARSEWVYEGDGFRFKFEIPKGTVASLFLGEKTYTLTEGTHTYYL